MTEDPEEKKHFTVKDRRRVSLESGAAPSPGAPDDAAGESQSPTEAAEPPAPETAAPKSARGPLPRVEFSAFVASLAAQAVALLGDDEHPSEGEAATREIIAILEMLQDKTEGRRTPDETKVLESVLFDLRMIFVQRGGASGP